jgi:hypothetical protein
VSDLGRGLFSFETSASREYPHWHRPFMHSIVYRENVEYVVPVYELTYTRKVETSKLMLYISGSLNQ